MKSIKYLVLLVAAGMACAVLARDKASFPVLPEFTHTSEAAWINTTPLTRADLSGKVVLIDVWTFDCWNCYRSFPWLTRLEAALDNEAFTVIGIHSPEFEHEKNRAAVVRKAAEFKLHHPIMLDNDLSYWNALGNRYWPAFYLIDKQGRARGYWVGETHSGDKRARQIESAIRKLLNE